MDVHPHTLGFVLKQGTSKMLMSNRTKTINRSILGYPSIRLTVTHVVVGKFLVNSSPRSHKTVDSIAVCFAMESNLQIPSPTCDSPLNLPIS